MRQSLYKLKVPDEVAGAIRTMHLLLKKKVKASLQMILADPNAGKPLKHELAGLRSFGVSKLRIIYRIASARVIEIVAIGPREKIYQETARISHYSP
jgi:mRNA interferase RelE/StbE